MKKILSLLMVVVMVAAMVTVGTVSVSAAADGTSAMNAIVLTDGEWFTKTWTQENDSMDCYNKIVVPARGCVEFKIQKPVMENGEASSYNLDLYDTTSTVIWEGNKAAESHLFDEYYVYKIGLNAGTYYLNIIPEFFISYNASPLDCKYGYTFTKTSYWEVESNDEFAKANALKIGSKYTGISEERIYTDDYFKVKLTKGKKYNIVINNFVQGTTTARFYNPAQESEYFTRDAQYAKYSYGVETVNGKKLTWTFKAKASGYHYIKLYNNVTADMKYSLIVSAAKIPVSETKMSLSATSYHYDGKKKTPTVKVKYGSKTLKKNTDYTVSYASGRTKVGTYKVKVTMKGAYTGTKTLTFKINPPKTTVKKLTAGKKSLKVSINKKKSQVSGYEIQYSTSKKFKSMYTKTKKVSGYKNTTKTLKSLKAKKTYYVRVRTYKTVSGKKYYSSWSSYKYKKTK